MPVVGATRYNSHDVLSHELRSEPASPCPADRAHDQPAARLDVRQTLLQKRRGVADVFDHLEQRQYVYPLLWTRGKRQILDRSVEVCQAAWFEEQRIRALVLARYGYDVEGRIDGGHGCGGREARGGFCEDAAAAADVEVFELAGRFGAR